MRTAPIRHPVAVLRQITGLSQKDLADLVGRKPRSIQSVELMTLRLSEGLANDIARETGVPLDWLLNGDVSKQPTADPEICGKNGMPYTRETYELARAKRESENGLNANDLWKRRPGTLRVPAVIAMTELWHLVAQLALPLFAAAKTGHEDLAVYRLKKFAEQFTDEFGYVVSEEALKFLRETRTRMAEESSWQEEIFPGFLKEHGEVFLSAKVPQKEWKDQGLKGGTFQEKLKSLSMVVEKKYIESVAAIEGAKQSEKPKQPWL